MDLFLDEFYKNDCEKKLNYTKLLYGFTSNTQEQLTIQNAGGESCNYIFAEDNAFLIICSNIDEVHVYSNTTKSYLQEVKISTNAKKFMI
jgi:hypothetical protein